MLIELECESFIQPRVSFYPGLNAVVGDANGSNSIGKSSFLMLIDFIFGGERFLVHNSDIIANVGHITLRFVLKFQEETFNFRRGTSTPDVVERLDSESSPIQSLNLEEYKMFLAKKYGLDRIDYPFRGAVGQFLRVWGKNNYDVVHPFQTKDQPEREAITSLIALFGKLPEIRTLMQQLKSDENAKNVLGKAFTQEFITKISKKKWEDNIKQIAKLEFDLKDIELNLAKYSLNISELTNRALLGLSHQKDKLLPIQNELEAKLERIRSNLAEQVRIRRSDFEALSLYFPNVNVKRLDEVERFHERLGLIVKKEIRDSERLLEKKLKSVRQSIAVLDTEIGALVKNVDNPSGIIESVISLTNQISRARNENYYYETFSKLVTAFTESKKSYSLLKSSILKNIAEEINREVDSLNVKISGGARRSATLSFDKNKYQYAVANDTGTGKAFIDLLMLDVAILNLSNLPFLIHDSFLFKNVENSSILNLFRYYSQESKQVFVAIDEVGKYAKEFVDLVSTRKVIELSNERLLFRKDWRPGTIGEKSE